MVVEVGPSLRVEELAVVVFLEKGLRHVLDSLLVLGYLFMDVFDLVGLDSRALGQLLHLDSGPLGVALLLLVRRDRYLLGVLLGLLVLLNQVLEVAFVLGLVLRRAREGGDLRLLLVLRQGRD